MMCLQKTCLRFFLLCIIVVCNSQTSCDYQLQLVSSQMGNFNTRGYNPLNVERIYSQLNSLRATVMATYQLCFGKIIIDPDSLYPQDISQCMMGLYNVSLLSATYTGNFAKIKSDIDFISKIVFSTQNDCRPVLYYRGWDNLTDDCKTNIQSLDDIINKYDQDIILGGNGLKNVNDLLLQVQKVRKLCGFNVLTKAKQWNKDNCSAANINWLYPLTDQIDDYIQKRNYINVTQSFYNLYQSVYRVKSICNVSNIQESDYDVHASEQNNIYELEQNIYEPGQNNFREERKTKKELLFN